MGACEVEKAPDLKHRGVSCCEQPFETTPFHDVGPLAMHWDTTGELRHSTDARVRQRHCGAPGTTPQQRTEECVKPKNTNIHLDRHERWRAERFCMSEEARDGVQVRAR